MMLATARRRTVRRAAFTLLEVLVVVAILVILAGVASISVFRYMEDAKVGRAKNDMQALKTAYESFYTQNGRWPENIQEVAPKLEGGEANLLDPWGQVYQVQVVEVQQADGQTIQRPVFSSQPPGNKPPIVWPEK